jgi:hypothetical protein
VTNAFLNETVYANTMLHMAKNAMVYGRLAQGKFRKDCNDTNGMTVSVKRPPRFVPNDASAQSAAFAPQDILTGSVSITANQYAKVHVSIGDIEHVKSYNELMHSSVMKAQASTLAHQIDSFVANLTTKFSSYVGHATTPTNNIGAPIEFNPVHTRLMNLGVPNSDLCSVILFEDAEEIRGSLLAGNIDGINKSALQKVKVPMLSDIDEIYASQQVPTITAGTRTGGGTSLIDNGTLSVNYRDVKDTMTMTIHVDTFTNATDTVKAGEILTIADVYAWDWRRQQALPYLQQFVVQQDATCSGSETDIVIAPPIIVQGTTDGTDTNGNTAFATVNAAAVDGAVVAFLGTASVAQRVRTAWHKSAIQLVYAPLTMPQTGKAAFAHDPETGISIRYWRGSDFATGTHGHRWDCFYGGKCVDVQMGSRVSGT